VICDRDGVLCYNVISTRKFNVSTRMALLCLALEGIGVVWSLVKQSCVETASTRFITVIHFCLNRYFYGIDKYVKKFKCSKLPQCALSNH